MSVLLEDGESAEDLRSSQPCRLRIVNWIRRSQYAEWSPLIQGTVRTVFVVVSDVLGQHLIEMASSEDDDLIEILSTDRSHDSFGMGVCPRARTGVLTIPMPLGGEHPVEAGGELCISIRITHLAGLLPSARGRSRLRS